jgi:hypothetical protein
MGELEQPVYMVLNGKAIDFTLETMMTHLYRTTGTFASR